MKKNVLGLLSVILISVFIFYGCAQTTSTPTQTTQPPTQVVNTATSKPAATATSAPATTTAAPKPAGPQQYGGVMRMTPLSTPAGPIGWPPANLGEMANPQQFAFEPLIRWYFDGHIDPCLATDWKVASDALSITFTLRKGVKFQDGTDFNAQAVKFNYDAFIQNKSPLGVVLKSVDVIDDYTVRVNLPQPNNLIFSKIGAVGATFVSPTAYQKNGLEWIKNNMVGTGPFKLTKWTQDVSAEFVKNTDYWRQGQPYLDGVKVVWIADPQTAAGALQAGDIDALQCEVMSLAASLKAKGFGVDYKTSGMISVIFDSANADSPFHDKRVRQAVDYAIDKEALVKAKGYGYWQAAYQYPALGTAAYNPNFNGRKYDPAKAKQLLAEAGYAKGFKWRLVVSPLGTDRDDALGIQNYLSKVGIDLSVEFPVYAKYLEYRQVGPWSGAMLMQPCLMPANPVAFFQIYIQDRSLFKSMERPAGLDDMVLAAMATPLPDVAKVRALSDYAYDEANILPIHNAVSTVIYNPLKVHDAGFVTLDDSFTWEPWKVWMSK
jgi:peptide/nickel transport system substrate-binding protein